MHLVLALLSVFVPLSLFGSFSFDCFHLVARFYLCLISSSVCVYIVTFLSLSLPVHLFMLSVFSCFCVNL